MIARHVRRGRHDERGASMILALVFVTVFGMASAATLTYADTALRTNQATQQRQAVLYNANGAIDTAINAMRPIHAWGRDGLACAGVDVNFEDDTSGAVACTPQAGSGVGSEPVQGGPSANAPANALVTNARSAEPGINIRTGVLPVGGAVVATSAIETPAGTQLDATNYSVGAAGACSPGLILSTPTASCPTSVSVAVAGAINAVGIPDWETAIPQKAPACNGKFQYVPLEPGRYTDAAALSALTSGSCPGTVVHLLPGQFHFDFAQRGFAAQWRITDATVTVVAGTAEGWTPPVAFADAPVVPASGACSLTANGSLLTFSSESALYVGGARNVELCGATQANGQVVSILGPWSDMQLPQAQLQRRCVALPRGCPFLMVTSAAVGMAGVLRVHGTVLAPTATIGIDLRAGAVAQFNRGSIVRSVYSWGTQTIGPVFTTKYDSSSGGYADRDVVLVVTIDGVRVGRARVEFADANGEIPGESVTIVEWNTTL